MMASLLPSFPHISPSSPPVREKLTKGTLGALPKGTLDPQSPYPSYLTPQHLPHYVGSSFPVTKLETSVPYVEDKEKSDFYVNLGAAVRTLREDLPLMFSNDLNYEIYREDITFIDPSNTVQGIENYKLIFWALRFHGRILFKDIWFEIFRVWQPSENVILIRWNLKGVPRVPWETMGQFQGTSKYKLDRNGKIYEHKVDNLAFNFPQKLRPASVFDLVTNAGCPASPNPTFFWDQGLFHCEALERSSWLEFYEAVKRTLEHEGYLQAYGLCKGLVTSS